MRYNVVDQIFTKKEMSDFSDKVLWVGLGIGLGLGLG